MDVILANTKMSRNPLFLINISKALEIVWRDIVGFKQQANLPHQYNNIVVYVVGCTNWYKL